MSQNLRAQRSLLISNASDAASRTLGDFTIDLVFIGLLGATVMDMGLLNTLGSLAFIFATIPAGHLIDSYHPIRMLRIGLSAKLVLMSCLLLTVLTGTLSIPLGFLLCALMGVCNVVGETAQVSAVPRIVEEEGEERSRSISKLVASLTAADQSLGIIIPAAVGTGFALLGASPLLAVAVALSAASLGFAWVIQRKKQVGRTVKTQASSPGAEELPEKHKLFGGLHYLRTHRTLRAITLAVTFSNLGLAIHGAIEGVFIINYLNLGAGWFGALTSIGAAGGLLGALGATKIVARHSPAQLMIGTSIAQVVLATLVLAAAFTPPVMSLALLAVQSFCWGIVVITFNIATASWVTDITPEGLLGRVTSARRLFTFGAIPVGSLVGGLVGTGLGIPAAIGAWILSILVGLLGYLWLTHPQGTAGESR